MTVRSTTIGRKGVDRSASPARSRGGVVDHLVLLKPRVMSLVVFTGAVGFALAPAPIDWIKLLAALSAMAAGAGACGALNMWWDADIDANMARTAMRPIPRGVVPPLEALAIGILLSVVSVAGLAIKVNLLAAALLALTIAIYVPLYTMVLKRSTPLNIVIGGAAGALPPVIGWAAATNSLSAGPIALFLITFLWTPPHFWALALCRSGDYERVGVPMLPNVVGPVKTCRQIVAYSVLLVPASLGPLLDPGRRPPLRRGRRSPPAPASSGARSSSIACATARNRRGARRRWRCSASRFSTCSSCSRRCSPRSCCGGASETRRLTRALQAP